MKPGLILSALLGSVAWAGLASAQSPPANTIPVAWMALDNGDVTATKTIHATNLTFFVGVGGTILVAADQPDGDYESVYFIDAQYQ